MLIRVGIENNNDGRSIAWALEHPGCFAYGADAEEASATMPRAVEEYANWLRSHGMKWVDDGPFEIRVEETFDAYRLPVNPQKSVLVESFFRCAAEPLNGMDVERACQLLDWSRKELLDSIKGLSDEQLNETRRGERWSINGILLHVGHAEWWYQACVGAPMPPDENDLPAEPLGCLELVRARLMDLLPKTKAVHLIAEVEGETWSFRKMLRRTVWHERDHTEHIRRLVREAGA